MNRREFLEGLMALPVVGALVKAQEEPVIEAEVVEPLDPAESPGTVAYQQAVLRNEHEALEKYLRETRKHIEAARSEAGDFIRGGTSGRR